MSRRLCLITGASAGIGAAFAQLYASRGWDLALTARRADRLEATAESLGKAYRVEVFALPADLAEPAAPERLLAEIAARGRDADGLVNNAGYGMIGPYAGSDWARHQALIQVLAVAPAELAHRVLPGMLERGFGRIVNVASLLGLTPSIPDHGLYSASKSFLVKLSETLHQESLGKGVHVTALCPGLTRSEFHDAPEIMAPTALAPGWLWMDAEAVAKAGYEAVEANRPICVPGAPYKALAALGRLLPERLGVKVAGLRRSRPWTGSR